MPTVLVSCAQFQCVVVLQCQTQVESHRTCTGGCGHTSVTLTPTSVVVLHLSDGLSTLAALLERDRAVRAEMIQCGICEPLVDARLQAYQASVIATKIRRLADCTFIQLARFRQDAFGNGIKDETNIAIPLILQEEVACPGTSFGMFDLQSVVLHCGSLAAGNRESVRLFY